MSYKYVETNFPSIVNETNPVGSFIKSGLQFTDDSVRLVRSCTKPSAKEFKKIAIACSIGFAIMGCIGYIVKLVFIPVNNILVS